MEFTIRKATPADALGIAIVSAYTWKTAYSGLLPEEMLDKRLVDLPKMAENMKQQIIDRDNYFVATVDDTIVGFTAICSPCRNPDYADSGEIGALYCLKGYNGYGIGRALFETAVKELVELGHKTMMIDCLRGNPTLGFYKHLGGKVVAERVVERIDHSRIEDVLFFDNIEKIIK